MKLIVAGSRTIEDVALIDSLLTHHVKQFTWVIKEAVWGCCPDGVDKVWKTLIDRYRFPYSAFPADWKQFGRQAGPLRNAQMAEYGDVLLLIWNGKSSGSFSMRTQMVSRNKPVFEVILRSV